MIASRYSNKAQIQMIETILVLFIFLLILIFGIYLYYQYSLSGIEQQSFELSEKQSTVLLSSISNLPELSCINEKDCVDIIKLINFKEIYNENKVYYSALFKNKKIIIDQVYPESQQNTCIFQNTFPIQCSSIVLHDSKPKYTGSKSIISMPLSIFYPSLNKYSLGKITIEAYK